MSRAFVRENDGWYKCTKHMEPCMMANEKGNCVLDHCSQYPEKDKKNGNTDQGKNSPKP